MGDKDRLMGDCNLAYRQAGMGTKHSLRTGKRMAANQFIPVVDRTPLNERHRRAAANL